MTDNPSSPTSSDVSTPTVESASPIVAATPTIAPPVETAPDIPIGAPIPVPKTLVNTDISAAKVNVPDIKVFGNGDLFQLIVKASSEREGWMKSTKAMEITNVGVVLQVTTQQKNPDGSYALAEAVTFVPSAIVYTAPDGTRSLRNV